MEPVERRDLRRYLRTVLRPEGQPVQLPRWSLRADAVFAVLVTVLVLLSTRHSVIAWQGAVSAYPSAPTAPLPAPPVDLTAVPVFPDWHHYLTGALAGLALAARRRFPLTTFWVVLIALRADYFLPAVVTLLISSIAICAAVLHSRNLIPVLGSFTLAALLTTTMFQNAESAVPPMLILMLVLGLIGGATRLWRVRVSATRLRIAEIQQAQEAAMRQAVEEERSRIAGELHDVVTHNVSVMVIQAGAARTVLDASPELAKEAMLAVEAGGRAAMAELRHVMGLLAASGTGPGKDLKDGRPSADELVPQPGLSQLPALVDRVRATRDPGRRLGGAAARTAHVGNRSDGLSGGPGGADQHHQARGRRFLLGHRGPLRRTAGHRGGRHRRHSGVPVPDRQQPRPARPARTARRVRRDA
jgi:hypothetical protein